MPNIYLIILNWNGITDTLNCLKSVGRMTTPHHVVVVDNGSTDNSPTLIADYYPNTHVIKTHENLGYAEGNNVGIRYALSQKADYILILNNDTLVTENLLKAFLKKNIPIQGALPILMETPLKLDHLGGMWDTKTLQFKLVGANDSPSKWKTPVTLDYLCGVALFIHANVFTTVGVFDPRFFLFWEECDWCFRARRHGYQLQTCPQAIIFHKRSASFQGGKPHTTYFWWRNRLLWIDKNHSTSQKKRMKITIYKEALKAFKHLIIKTLLYPFSKRSSCHRRRLLTYRAQLTGVSHYLLGRFGDAPQWIVNNNK